jgi:hypothetical protein
MKIRGIEFDIEVDWDRDGRIESLAIFLPGSEDELSEVLSEKVVQEIEESLYRSYEGTNINEDDPRQER